MRAEVTSHGPASPLRRASQSGQPDERPRRGAANRSVQLGKQRRIRLSWALLITAVQRNLIGVLNSQRRAGVAGISAAGRLAGRVRRRRAARGGRGRAGGRGGRGRHPQRGQHLQHAQACRPSGRSRRARRSWTPYGHLIAYYYPQEHLPGAGHLQPDRAGDAQRDRRDRGLPVLRSTARSTCAAPLRALANDLSSNAGTQGGSTLAQQYVKNALILTATDQAAAGRARPRTRSAARSASCGWPPTSSTR